MSTWLVVWFVVGLVTTVVLVAFLVSLGRHGLVLGRSARRFGEEIGPLAGEISREGARASERAAGLRWPAAAGRNRRRR